MPVPSALSVKARVAAAIAVAVVALYVQTFFFPFVYFDDDVYVFQNPVVTSGLTWPGVLWAFTSGYAANWHPLTWLSHMLDVQLFGMAAGAHHAVSVAFHALNCALLFLLLHRMTGATGRSACLALLFAVHPVNVESVAWIAERKNVLSTFFLFVTLIAYVRYVERPGFARYGTVFAGLVCGLMAKPMLVTLPFAMMLLDYWPLNRYAGCTPMHALRRAGRLAYEKTPLFLLSLIASIVTYVVQQQGQAMEAMAGLTLRARLANAILAYVGYLKHLVWPVHLSAIYPFPSEPAGSFAIAAALLLLGVFSAVSLVLIRRAPYLFVGWFWFVGTLIPTIGIVQVGYQSMADRYLYVPAIGIFLIVAWGAEAIRRRLRINRRAARIAAASIFSVLAVLCWRETAVWRGTVPLFEHAIAVTGVNAEAHNHLGYYYLTQNEPAKAVPHFEAAHRERPNLSATYSNWGAALRMQGDVPGAIQKYHEALRLNPDDPTALGNLGVALLQLGRVDEARERLEEAVRLNPNSANTHTYLGIALIAQGDTGEAIRHLRRAVALDPGHTQARAALDALQPEAYHDAGQKRSRHGRDHSE